MIGVLHIFELLLPIAYAAVFALYLQQFLRDDDTRAATPSQALYGVLATHVLFFVLRGVELGFAPFATKADFLSLVALSIGAVYAVIETSQRRGHTGVFFLAPVLVLQAIGSMLMAYDKKHTVLLENPIFAVHVVFLVLGFVGLAVGAMYALMYVLMMQQLKAHNLGVFFKRLPPLMELERMSKRGTVAGVALLGLGLGTGAVLGLTIEEFEMFDPKNIASFVIWFGYLAGVLVAKLRGLSGVQTAWGSMIWFAIFLFSVAIANHSFT